MHPSTGEKRPSRGFWPLVALQAQGAFSDNAFKQLLLLLVAGMPGSADPNEQGYINGVLLILFSVAYLVFSCWAGFIADKYSKRSVTLVTKAAEIGIMALAALVLLRAGEDGLSSPVLWLAFVVMFLMFAQSAFFSPAKYGIIPELVEEKRLGWANGVISLTTYVAIILGMAVTPELYAWLGNEHAYWVPVGLVGLAALGLAMGMGIGPVPAANPTRGVELNFLPELKRYIRILTGQRDLLLVVLGLSYFWSLGAVVAAHLIVWGNHSLGLSAIGAGRLYWFLALGVAAGSALAGVISRRRIEVGLVPLGGLVIALFTLPAALAEPGNRALMMACVGMIGVGSGLFVVPLNALLQQLTDLRDRGGLLAVTNYFTQAAMLIAVALYIALNKLLKVPPNGIFLLIGLATLAGTFITLKLLPEALLRLIGLFLTNLIYRIRVFGRPNIPMEGPVLLVSNHVSYVDALLLSAACPRPIRFVVYQGIYEKPLLNWMFRITKAIPVAADQNPRDLLRSLRTAGETLRDGGVVCIFAEGQISRTGNLLPFRRGFEQILKHGEAPVVPVYLDGMWGSVFSFEGGRFFWKWPRQIPYRVRIMFGRALPPTVNVFDLRQSIVRLSAEASIAGKPDHAPLGEQFVRRARKHWRLFMMLDAQKPELSMGRALTGSLLLARWLASRWGKERQVGIFLPPGVPGALVNYAATLSGRTAVNLNYTTGQEVLDACARQCSFRTVVTSRQFMEKIGLRPPGVLIELEAFDPAKLGGMEKLAAWLVARLAPVRWVGKWARAARRPGRDSLATIIFSSGSTGQPKGVMLSHFNISANISSFEQGFHIWPHERILGTLPFFHSFGYTVALWGSALFPYGVVYHNNPLDLKTVGELVEKRGVTVVITTPTFLTAYLRRLSPGVFGGVEAIITGAEKLTDALREAVLDRFGIEPLQGYGSTECAPVVSVNVDSFRDRGFYQVGHKRGSVGHPLPGIAVKVIDPETGEELGEAEPGLLWVKGANVMHGYLGMPERSAEVLRDGWYNTGDVGFLDADGFIFITDRLSRFSKIGGEMVPHVTVEEKLHQALGLSEQRLAVTALPDEKKGEQLVVLHTLEEEKFAGMQEKLAGAGLANLWIPSARNYFKVAELPVLGTGKLDLKGIRKMAEERMAAD